MLEKFVTLYISTLIRGKYNIPNGWKKYPYNLTIVLILPKAETNYSLFWLPSTEHPSLFPMGFITKLGCTKPLWWCMGSWWCMAITPACSDITIEPTVTLGLSLWSPQLRNVTWSVCCQWRNEHYEVFDIFFRCISLVLVWNEVLLTIIWEAFWMMH